MKKALSAILALGLISLSGFIRESVSYEQIAFDYFVSDIIKSDFKEVTSIEFSGKTEASYSTLGNYQFCLKPQEKLGSIIEGITKGATTNEKEIRYKNLKGLTIRDFQSHSKEPRLFVYPTVHVADNYYVFMAFQKLNEQPVRYVVELSPDGSISRSCNMD